MNIYKINASENYLKALAQFVFEECRGDYAALAECTILLPTKRACLHLKNYFCELAKNKAAILPKISSIGETDEEELALDNFLNFGEELELKRVISNEKRLIITAELIRQSKELQIDESEINFEQSIKLAKSLLQLVDDFNRYDVPYKALEVILPEELSVHNQKTLNFLSFFFKKYDEILNKLNLTDQISRRNYLIKKLSGNLKLKNKKIFIAGTTGTMSGTRNLIKQALTNENCYFILPYIDSNLKNSDFEELLLHKDLSNHQAHIAELLKFLEVSVEEVKDISDTSIPLSPWERDGVRAENNSTSQRPHPNPLPKVEGIQRILNERKKNISNIMLPASKVHSWNNIKENSASNSINIVEAENEIEEAKLISLIVRDKFEENKNCAIITNNKSLAKKLQVLLNNYGIKGDASFGRNLNELKEGKFILKIANLISSDFKIVELLEVLKDSMSISSNFKNDLEYLENKNIRINNVLNLSDIDAKQLKICDEIKNIILQLQKVKCSSSAKIKDLIAHCIEIAGYVIDKSNVNYIIEEAFEILRKISNEIEGEAIETKIFAKFLNEILASKTIRENLYINNKLQILTPIEARLLDFNCVVLAGLNQDIWPKSSPNNWLSESMLSKLSLPDDEFYISAAAHDFASLMHKGEIYLTYSNLIDCKVAIKSQFINRVETYFETIANSSNCDDIYSEGKRFKNYLRQMEAENIIKYEPEIIRVKPPEHVRANKISATAIDKTLENPYDFYAKNILKLRKLDRLEKQPEPADYGNYVHQVIEDFTNFHKFDLEKITISVFSDIAVTLFKSFANKGVASDLWILQMNVLAPWLVEIERKKAPLIKNFYSEVSGEYTLQLDNGKTFTLTAKADRIEIYKDGTYRIIDFKTGEPPEPKKVIELRKPQLLVEGLIATKGSFFENHHNNDLKINLSTYKVAALEYYRLKNSADGFEVISIDNDLGELIAKTETEAEFLAKQLLDSETEFLALPDGIMPQYSDYLHLMRVS
ncbi:MAG TPA: hypothetical protein DIV86_00895 [Alphaproteobacteria bacterium]|nr:hypothetical protein [Alphaproteobacteria bacterium]